MNSFENFFSVAGIPFLCFLWAVGLLGVWARHRSHRDLLWQVVCLLFLAGAFLKIMAAWMLWCAAWAAAQALAVHYRGSIKFYIAVCSSVLVLFASWLIATWEWSSVVRWILGSMAMGAVLVHVMPLAWGRAVQHRGDVWLRGTYFVCTVFVFLMPLVDSVVVRAEIAVVLALSLSTALAVCAWMDSQALTHRPQHRDAQTQLLNRAGLDAVCGPFLAQQAITVVMLCELKSSQPTDMAPSSTALAGWARLLHATIRDKGWIARTGTTEFVVALQHTELPLAQILAARVHAALSQDTVLQGYTASFGLAQVHAMDTMDLALHRADVALCQSKEDGRSFPHRSPSSSAA